MRAAPTVSRARVDKKTHTSIQVQRKQSGLPCAMALQLIPCSPRRDLACLSPSFPRSLLLANLTPAIGASGPHDFAVRTSRARQSQLSRPSHPTPRVVTCATPLSSGGMAQEVKLICLRDQARSLRHIGTTGKSVKCCQDLFDGSMRFSSLLPLWEWGILRLDSLFKGLFIYGHGLSRPEIEPVASMWTRTDDAPLVLPAHRRVGHGDPGQRCRMKPRAVLQPYDHTPISSGFPSRHSAT